MKIDDIKDLWLILLGLDKDTMAMYFILFISFRLEIKFTKVRDAIRTVGQLKGELMLSRGP